MANSVDIGTLAIGALIGYGLRREIKASAEVCKSALLATAGVAATAAAQVAEAGKQGQGKSGKSGKGQNPNGN